jgi:transcriptional antiterminator NusG
MSISMADEKLENEQTAVPPHEDEAEAPSTLAEYDQDVLEEGDAVADEEIHAEEIHAEQIHADDHAEEPAEHHQEHHGEGHGEDPVEGDDGVHGMGHDAEVGTEGEQIHAASPDELLGPLKHWYIIHAYSGFEQKVAESLKSRAQAFGFAGRLGQILIPTEEVIELRNGKKVTSKRLLYPGYVLVEMEMDDELWHAVKSTPRVTGFVGGGTKPVPLTADEVNAVLYRQASSADRPRPKMTFEKNETVKIVDGPFTNFSGKVDEVNSERNTLRVMVTIFGRSTPVELDFLQVEKI